MVQLENTKCSFLFCLGICILICSAIYLKAKISNAPLPTNDLSSQSPLACETCDILPPATPGFKWQRKDCKKISYEPKPDTNCTLLQSELHFIMAPLSKEEEDFPLAFIITIHKELETFVRLLRAIYAPQNVYCIHIDDKAPEEYKTSVRNLSGCFSNVFLASVNEKVTYAGFSRLQADINCMKDLVKSPIKWKRVINLCGQDFPIQSNLELVRYMQGSEWKDRNMTPGIKQPPTMKHRTEFQYEEVKGTYVAPKGRGQRKGPPPHSLTIYFGTAYYSLTRPFVEFVLKDPVAKDLLEWSRDTFSPDEHYWVTLNHIKEAPGSHVDGEWEGNIRAIKWRDQEGTAHQGCKGQYIRDICVFGIGDLPWIIKKESMFANKFETASFPEALDCLELWHRHKVLQHATVPIQPSWRLITEVEVINSTLNVTAGDFV
ncbi:beta-1,3-galactosyl-O-glycosyl-glycoprotein beta-1,6-N-acetylglucosaminyltransferase 7 [Ctenopharyngodon idella]|uniref:beta-1,3-galactosyl-O-glycosyl-glycoprotein beta-1,6-N-acetylglucosaminyltransferase 7 n=1 Tax=Ctenopharyngodon idella TaxID=7959 RepID=UPI00223179A7|nr:beta-1,3-galactosyl-O-glycosyl-glycoprotein beta-1,6-N-acetylglucosaminyltransferase 7 [Ctenopharyngodon idella]XP_051752644.1 beta-1,3-galactosyl-O-glycosyl-glycoprotein beta-1,6-N-acetylglucosaminyltransferase 7 [Ctenopharyngodon idella]